MRRRITVTLDVVTDETRADLLEEALLSALVGQEVCHAGEWFDESVESGHQVEFEIVGAKTDNREICGGVELIPCG